MARQNGRQANGSQCSCSFCRMIISRRDLTSVQKADILKQVANGRWSASVSPEGTPVNIPADLLKALRAKAPAA